MISKRKRNTILVYCMASVVMLCALASNITKVNTSMKTNSKKVVADNHSVETTELSYGLVAIEASSSIEENKDAQNVTENKKEENKEDKKEESNKKTDSNKNSSANKSNSNKTTTKTTTSNKTTSNKTTTKTTTSNKTTSNKTATKTTTSNKTTSNKTTTKTTTTTKSTTNTANSSKGVQIAEYAKKFVGKSYRMGGSWNGEMPYTATDCSGFTQGVYKHFGISLPRVARDQAKVGKKVSFNELQPGDLVFYSGNGGKSVTHVALYIGNGKIVHAQTPKLGIGITTYNIMIKMTARRVI